MSIALPPIYPDCRRVLVLTEEAVQRLARYHKYTVGTELRRAAMEVMRAVNRAVHDRGRLPQDVHALAWRVDYYKLTLGLAMDVGAFAHTTRGAQGRASPSFQAFEEAARLAAEIGKQCGGWQLCVARQVRAQADGAGAPTDASPQAAVDVAGSTPVPQASAHPASLSAQAAAPAPRHEARQ